MPGNLTDVIELASRYPSGLRFIFKPTVSSIRTGWTGGGERHWPCLRGPWPREAHAGEKPPPRIWVFHSQGTVCIVGFGWVNRAEQSAAMLMRGMLSVHNNLARSSPHPSSYRLHEFKHPVSVNLNDWYLYGHKKGGNPSQLAYACKGDRPGACGIGLVPHFLFENYLEAGVGDFPELSQQLAAIGSRPARRRICGWAGNHLNHEQRSRFAEQAAMHPHLLACAKHKQYVPIEAQVEEWACMVDLVGYGFSARVPLLLHSGRVLLKVTPPPPTPWVWYEDPAVFPEVLTPWKHFVPVDANFTDLVERVEWIQNNQRKADRIGAAGQAYARRYLTRTRSSEYFARQVLIASQCDFEEVQPLPAAGFASSNPESPNPPCSYAWAPTHRMPLASSVSSPAARRGAGWDSTRDRWDQLLEGYDVGA